MIKKIAEFHDMAQLGSAFVPSYGASSRFSAQFLFKGTAVFPTAMEALGKTPLSLWQQRMIYLSPLVIGMLPSFNKSEEKEKISHYPLMIYDNIAKVAVIASVIIISRTEGNHYLAGIITQGVLLHAKENGVISLQVFLIIQIAIEMIGPCSKIIIAESLGKRVITFIEMVPTQFVLFYQFPSMKPWFNHKIQNRTGMSIENLQTTLQTMLAKLSNVNAQTQIKIK
jgi:hypothetical protein